MVDGRSVHSLGGTDKQQRKSQKELEDRQVILERIEVESRGDTD